MTVSQTMTSVSCIHKGKITIKKNIGVPVRAKFMQGNLRAPDFSNKIERGNKFSAWPINEEKCQWLCQERRTTKKS